MKLEEPHGDLADILVGGKRIAYNYRDVIGSPFPRQSVTGFGCTTEVTYQIVRLGIQLQFLQRRGNAAIGTRDLADRGHCRPSFHLLGAEVRLWPPALWKRMLS